MSFKLSKNGLELITIKLPIFNLTIPCIYLYMITSGRLCFILGSENPINCYGINNLFYS